jgi:hypothetical protein
LIATMILWLSFAIMIIGYNLASDDSFFLLNALFITLVCGVLWFKTRETLITFLFFALSLNNLFDELFFDNTKIEINELAFFVIVPLIWFFKK